MHFDSGWDEMKHSTTASSFRMSVAAWLQHRHAVPRSGQRFDDVAVAAQVFREARNDQNMSGARTGLADAKFGTVSRHDKRSFQAVSQRCLTKQEQRQVFKPSNHRKAEQHHKQKWCGSFDYLDDIPAENCG